MDKTYIQEQKILELYVLGELNESEIKKVERALISYPELRTELSIIEESFEKLAFENAIQPSDKVKIQLLDTISKSDTKVVDLKPKKSNYNKLKFAASIAAIFLIGSIFLYVQWNATQNQLKIAEEQNSELNKKLDLLIKDYNDTNTLFTAINNPNTEKYILKGNNLMPEAKLISYVNDEDKSVIVNTSYLPKLDDKHDYQMWADVDGEMIDMGVIDLEKSMLAMNYIENSESLNITIEPAGGSEHPTVSQLITNIYLK